MTRRSAIAAMAAAPLAVAAAPEWSEPAEVHHDDRVCMSYQAKLDGPYLLIRVKLDPGWHTFAIDNKQRVDEKLAGRKALAQDRPTEISVSGGLQTVGTWLQSPPRDFSKPELRLFAYGFENEAMFAIRVKGSGAAKIAIQAQACTESVCKNVDVALSLRAAQPSSAAPAFDVKKLAPARVST